ncbi:hypothetical protein AOLI_G00198590 [Acnodon oligacanthus]
MRVRPGDNVVLYSDCVWKSGINIVWIKNSSKEHLPLFISLPDLLRGAFPHHAFVWNHPNQTYDLLVKNVTETDQGLYYCAHRVRTSIKNETGADVQTDVYYYGNGTTRLSLREPTPPVSDCSICWKLLVSVCPVCVLLSSTCVYCICRYTTAAEKKHNEGPNGNKEDQKRTKRGEAGGDDVIYSPLDITSRGQNHPVQHSDICTYSEIMFE